MRKRVTWSAARPAADAFLSAVRQMGSARRLSTILIVLGGFALLGAAGYALYGGLTTWLRGQDRYLLAGVVAPIAMPTRTPTAAPPTATVTASPTPSPVPTVPTPRPTRGTAPPPVQIRIPAIGVSRSIVSLPGHRDRTGVWSWNTKALFREGRPDVVGHWEASANPGEPGNTILVGHNYGYGYNGVFVSLGRLKAGQQVIVVNKAGESFTYKVTTVKRLKWRRKDFAELTEHLTLLDPGGKERLTLVSCAGADIEPFPERIYVVAEPLK